MKEHLKEFFKDKKNIILVVLVGVTLLSVIVAAFWEFFSAISCILFGLTCIYVAYMLFLRHLKLVKNKTSEFMTEESTAKRRTRRFLESENKVNSILLIVLFLIMGGMLVFYGFNLF